MSPTPTQAPGLPFSQHRWPLTGYENASPLSDEKQEDGKSLRNPNRGDLSSAYTAFPDPLRKDRRGGFDIHVYYMQTNESQVNFAWALWQRIRREFPELRVYRLWDRPVGPHPMAMFEVNVFTPEQFGAFIPWLAVWRGNLSVLVHPNTYQPGESQAVNDLKDHTERAIWMGERVPLDVSLFQRTIVAEQTAHAGDVRHTAA